MMSPQSEGRIVPEVFLNNSLLTNRYLDHIRRHGGDERKFLTKIGWSLSMSAVTIITIKKVKCQITQLGM